MFFCFDYLIAILEDNNKVEKLFTTFGKVISL